jgi:hypothetical protein
MINNFGWDFAAANSDSNAGLHPSLASRNDLIQKNISIQQKPQCKQPPKIKKVKKVSKSIGQTYNIVHKHVHFLKTEAQQKTLVSKINQSNNDIISDIKTLKSEFRKRRGMLTRIRQISNEDAIQRNIPLVKKQSLKTESVKSSLDDKIRAGESINKQTLSELTDKINDLVNLQNSVKQHSTTINSLQKQIGSLTDSQKNELDKFKQMYFKERSLLKYKSEQYNKLKSVCDNQKVFLTKAQTELALKSSNAKQKDTINQIASVKQQNEKNLVNQTKQIQAETNKLTNTKQTIVDDKQKLTTNQQEAEKLKAVIAELGKQGGDTSALRAKLAALNNTTSGISKNIAVGLKKVVQSKQNIESNIKKIEQSQKNLQTINNNLNKLQTAAKPESKIPVESKKILVESKKAIVESQKVAVEAVKVAVEASKVEAAVEAAKVRTEAVVQIPTEDQNATELFKNGSIIRLKSKWGGYISMNSDGATVDHGKADSNSFFIVKKLPKYGPNAIGLFGKTSRYLRARNNRRKIDQGDKVDSFKVSPTDKLSVFTLENAGKGKIALRTYNDTYVQAGRYKKIRQGRIIAKGQPLPEKWVRERFTPIFISRVKSEIDIDMSVFDNKLIKLKTSSNYFVNVAPDGTFILQSKEATPYSSLRAIRLKKFGKNCIALLGKTNRFIRSHRNKTDMDQSGLVTGNGYGRGNQWTWVRFFVEGQENGTYVFRTFHNSYLQAASGSRIVQKLSNVGGERSASQQFTVISGDVGVESKPESAVEAESRAAVESKYALVESESRGVAVGVEAESRYASVEAESRRAAVEASKVSVLPEALTEGVKKASIMDMLLNGVRIHLKGVSSNDYISMNENGRNVNKDNKGDNTVFIIKRLNNIAPNAIALYNKKTSKYLKAGNNRKNIRQSQRKFDDYNAFPNNMALVFLVEQFGINTIALRTNYNTYIQIKKESTEEVGSSNEKLTGAKGNAYRGKQNKSISGKTCQKWTNQTPHKHGNTPEKKKNLGLGDHNYCRNPDGEKTIWCYTTDKSKRWEFCTPKQGGVARDVVQSVFVKKGKTVTESMTEKLFTPLIDGREDQKVDMTLFKDSIIRIKTNKGNYLTMNSDSGNVSQEQINDNGMFYVQLLPKYGYNCIALLGKTGRYLRAHENKTIVSQSGPVPADRKVPDDWTWVRLFVERQDNKTYVFKTAHGTYLQSGEGGKSFTQTTTKGNFWQQRKETDQFTVVFLKEKQIGDPIGKFIAENYTNNKMWKNIAGNQNATQWRGNPTVQVHKNGNISFKAIKFERNDGLRFHPTLSTSKYTFAVVGRNRRRQGRVINGTTGNVLHGWWGNRTGVFHQGGWLTHKNRGSDSNWHVMVATNDGKAYYDGQSVSKSKRKGASPAQWTVNWGQYQRGEWTQSDIAEIQMFDRHLSHSQLTNLSNMLARKYGVESLTPVIETIGKSPAVNKPIAHFTAENYENNKNWRNIVGVKPNATRWKGTTVKVEQHTNGKMKFKAIKFGRKDGVRFDEAISTPKYTIFAVGRNRRNNGRVIDGTTGNVLHGWWGNRTGVFHQGGWLTHRNRGSGPAWGVMAATNNGRSYFNGRLTSKNNRKGRTPEQWTINWGQFARNEWTESDVAEMIFYDKHLSDAEMLKESNRLTAKYGITSLTPVIGKAGKSPAVNKPIAHFTAENYTNNRNWINIVGVKPNVTEWRGNPTVQKHKNRNKLFKAIKFERDDGARFDEYISKPNYSIIAVGRNRRNNGRVIVGTTHNTLHGWWNNRTGVYHYGTWSTHTNQNGGSSWSVMAAANNGTAYYNGKKVTRWMRKGRTPQQWSINWGQYHKGEWTQSDIAEMIFYDKHLTDAEFLAESKRLTTKYGIPSLTPLIEAAGKSPAVNKPIAHFSAENYQNNKNWKNIVGVIPNATQWVGNPILQTHKNGNKTFKAIKFERADGLRFHSSVSTKNWTLIAVGRNRRGNGRVIDGTNGNVLHGWWGGRTGVYHYGSWSTHKDQGAHKNWHVMASTNVGHSFFDGKLVASKIARTSRTPAQWTINWGQFKGGEWTQSDIAEMIFYNKHLSDAEIVKESDRLCAKYGIPSQKPPAIMKKFTNGARVQLRTFHSNRNIQMRPNAVKQHTNKGVWETFTVKLLPQFGNNVIALFGAHGKYMRAHSNKKTIDQSGRRPHYNSYPNGWTWERWWVEDVGGGKIALRSYWNTYLRAHSNGNMDSNGAVIPRGKPMPKGWAWEKFTPIFVAAAKPKTPTTPGCYLYSNTTCPKQRGHNKKGKWHRDAWGEKNRGSGKTDALCKKRVGEYNRWCGVNDHQHKLVLQPKALKIMEKFKNGAKLRLKTWRSNYLRMRSNGKHVHQGGAGREEILTVKRLPQFGPNVIALYGVFKRYLRGRNNKKTIDQSGARPNYNSYPKGWTWERWWVEDVGGGKIALRSYHNTYLRANRNGWMDMNGHVIPRGKPMPKGWAWEKFTPVFLAAPKALKIMEQFKNGRRLRLKTYTNKYVRMRSNGRDVHLGGAGREEILTVKRLPQFGPNVIALYGVFRRYLRARNDKKTIDQSGARPNYNSYPNGWTWERWTVVDKGGGKIALKSFHNTYLRTHTRMLQIGGSIFRSRWGKIATFTPTWI